MSGPLMPHTPCTSHLYEARVGHTRTHPVRNSFEYGGYLWLVDLDALPRLPRGLGFLARFEARDHLGRTDATIKANVEAFLSANGVELGGGRVLMLANARVCGYVFNPLSVHWCYDRADRLVAVLAEVHNTYGERHVYLLRPDAGGRAGADKALYVSPFFDTAGRYEMHVSPPADKLAVSIALRRGGRTPFTATLRGTRRPASLANVLRASLRHPLMPLWVSVLIRFQGIRLWARRLPVVARPRHRPQQGVQ